MEVKFALYDRKITDYIFGVLSLLLLVFSAFVESFAGDTFEHMMFISLIITSLFGCNYFLYRQYYRAIFGWERYSRSTISFTEQGVAISQGKENTTTKVNLESSAHFELYYNVQYSLSNIVGIKMFILVGVSEINFIDGEKKCSFKFIVVNPGDQTTLTNILRVWYKHNYSFKEFVDGEKSHLLKSLQG